MSRLQMELPGYACVPYRHDANSARLRRMWARSENVSNLFFATATFSPECKPYFSNFANHYMVAQIRDSEQVYRELKMHLDDTAFVFVLPHSMTGSNAPGGRLISFYYARYAHDSGQEALESIFEAGSMVARAWRGHLRIISSKPARFAFPYGDSVLALEATGEKSHQGLNQYCEKTKADMARHGISLTKIMGISVLENLK